MKANLRTVTIGYKHLPNVMAALDPTESATTQRHFQKDSRMDGYALHDSHLLPASSSLTDGAFSRYMQRGKCICPTYPPDIALLTFDSNNFGLSLNTAAASALRGSS